MINPYDYPEENEQLRADLATACRLLEKIDKGLKEIGQAIENENELQIITFAHLSMKPANS